MSVAIKRPSIITFENYVAGNFDCPWSDCLWVDGELVQVPPESGQNNAIARYLFLQFKLHAMQAGLALEICIKDTEIEVNSTKHRTRKPDVMVISTDLDQALRNRSSVITKDLEPPVVIVEVISKQYRNVDLIDKEQEYLERVVPEYWTVDWERTDPHIIVRSLQEQPSRYVAQTYRPGAMVLSTMMPELRLKVEDVLEAR